jgi:hypothetical protein
MIQPLFRLNRIAIVGAIVAVGMAIGVSSFGVVRAEHAKPDKSKTFNCSTGAACVEGNSTGTSTAGVYGTAAIADGVHGVTSGAGSSGVSGISTGTTGTGHGVYGRSSNGQGVYGTSSNSNGVEGHSTAPDGAGTGVAGYAEYGSGDGTGVYGNGYFGLVGEGNYSAVTAEVTSLYSYIFQGFDTANNAQCSMDWDANLSCTGTIQGGSQMSMRHKTSDGRHVLAYAAQSTSATIEDVGTARMSNGVANVQIDSAFASVTDHKWYYVFLTPLGDTRGLYVSMKTTSAFQVRETEHGRSNLEFDYRIVAHPFDAKDDRLPAAPAMPRFRVPQPAR